MIKNRKRTKQVILLIDETNSFLKENKVKDINDSLFRFVRDLLIKNRMYNVDNFYKDEEIKVENGDVATKMVLAGSCTDYDYLQLW